MSANDISGRALTDAERLDWLRLLRSDHVGARTFRSLIRHYGSAAEALNALPGLARRGGASGTRVCPATEAEREMALAARMGVAFIGMQEPGYPARLRMIDDAPPLLAVRGQIATLSRPMVAVVGSRNASAGRSQIR